MALWMVRTAALGIYLSAQVSLAVVTDIAVAMRMSRSEVVLKTSPKFRMFGPEKRSSQLS